MAQVPLTKVRIISHAPHTAALVKHLQDRGCLQITESPHEGVVAPSEQEDFSYATLAARLESAITFLSPYAPKGDALQAIFEGNRTHTTYTTIETLARSEDPTALLDEAAAIHARIIEIDAATEALRAEEDIIRAWERINLPLNDIGDTPHTVAFPLHAGARDLDAVANALAEEPLAHVERVSDSALLVVAHRSSREVVETVLRDQSVVPLRLPQTHGLPHEELVRIQETREALASEKAALEERARTIASSKLDTLKQLADHAIWGARRTKKLHQLPRTEHTVVIDAWMPRAEVTSVTEELERTFGAVAVSEIEPREGEVPPTAIANRGFSYPFEFITRLYGVPGHRDLDPTPFLSLFFALFFGLCLSDVGYGFTLAALTGFVLLRYRIVGGMRQLMLALNIGGISAIIMGALYGGYFGLSAADVHPALVTLQKFDPIANPMPVFFLALTVGVLHVMFGIILDIKRAAHQGVFIDGLLDNVPWLVMFAVLITYILAFANVIPEPARALVLAHWDTAAIIAALGIALTKARLGKNIGDKLVKGVLALYGGVNYFSDILSYSRLLALGLSTSALGYSINLIAEIIGGTELGIGTLFAIIILLFGHTLNLVLSTLGAFINSARLQYVEFFSKFLGSSGKPFMPLTREPKHTLLLPEKPG